MTTTTQRVCVTCDQPITPTSPTRYAHSDPSTGRDHDAQPKLAHPMDTDPFASCDDEHHDGDDIIATWPAEQAFPPAERDLYAKGQPFHGIPRTTDPFAGLDDSED